MNELYRHSSLRASLARLHKLLSGGARYVFYVSILATILLGGLLVVEGQSFGWFVFSLSAWFFIPLVWDKRYLRILPAEKGMRIDDRLEPNLLALLPTKLDRNTLVDTLPLAQSVQFMMVRAGVSPGLISEQLDEQAIAESWRYALELQPQGVVKAGAFFAGLIKCDPALTGLLPHLQMDQQDVDNVVKWYDHLESVIAFHRLPQFDGGVARDWSFGYTPQLSRYGVNVSEQVAYGGGSAIDIEAHQDALDYIKKIFSSAGKQNVALVGPNGVGKTTVVKAFAEQILSSHSYLPSSLKFRQVISLDAASLIASASGRGQLEQLIHELLAEAYHAKNIILCLDEAQLFFEEGVGSVDVSKLFQPVLDGGVLRVILTMDEQRFLQISKRNPVFAQSFNRFMVAPASRQETMLVMQDQLIVTEFQNGVTYMYQALSEAYRLSERYLYDVAQPGKSLQLLISASQYAENGLVTAVSVKRAIEQTQGVKIGANVDSEDRDRLLNLEQLIHERMINQTHAVTVVSDALRRARAGVRNEKKPIGTFLFLGPTGVGKTELAKSLAEVYFDGEDHLIRLDMNEFVEPDDVRRLIADGADDPHSLSSQVMRQPFSVVLLDELEKAHDSVLETLLQVLDEGILRDIKGREISFRDTIIIATSNAGAEHIRHHIEAGEELSQFEEELNNELITSGQFRPEFLNRFDEIVLFRPLGEMELAKVVELIIAGVNKTLEPQKITVSITTGLKAWLVVNGNDPRLGARPMRRIVQRVVENVMAKRLLAGAVQPGDTVELTLADIPVELQK